VAKVTKKLKGLGFGNDEQEISYLIELQNEIPEHTKARKIRSSLRNGLDRWKRYLMLWKFLIIGM